MSTAGLPPGTALNHDNLGPQIITASWTLTAVSALFLFTRMFAKLWTRRGLWLDDYMLIMAWLAVLVPAITSTLAVREGLGQHVYDVTISNAHHLAILTNTTVTILVFASALSKTSFALTVMRLVTGPMKWAAWYILVSTNIFFGINIILLWITFNPNPMPPPSATPARSVSEDAPSNYGIFVTAYSAAMDFALVGMAWVVVSGLRMRSRREKLGVGLAMSMGIIAGITSIIKATIFPTLVNGDITFTAASLHIWSIAEPSVTIIAASIPLLRIIFTQVKHLTTQKSATPRGPGNTSESGPSVGGNDKNRRVTTSAHVASQSGRPYGQPYGNLEGFESSEENVMLDDLQDNPRLRTGDSQMHSFAKDEEEGIAPVRPASVLDSQALYERRLARKYAAGSTTPTPDYVL